MILKSVLKRIDFWFKCARYQSYAQSLLPAVIAFAVVAGKKNEFHLNSCDFLLGIFAILGVILAHSGANLLDDYFDYCSQAVQKRREMSEGGIRARSLKCSYLDSGLATTKQLLVAALAFCALATACGGVILQQRGMPIFVCFAIGALLAFFYSAPPFRLSYHGLGEVVVGLLFGPVVMSGVSYSLCGRLDSAVAYLSIPMGILAANILYVHSIMDLEPDRRAGKYTLAALLGTQRRAVGGCGVLLGTCYLTIIIGVLTKALAPWTLLVIITAPIAFELYAVMRLYLIDPSKKLERKRRHGPMECWDMICAAGIDWFMFRWYLARNLLTSFAFCLLFAIIVDCLF